MKELLQLLFLKQRRGWLPSCWNKEEEEDYYCKTKKRQNVKCIAIVISKDNKTVADNKADNHCQFVILVGGLLYWTDLLLYIESLDMIIQDVISY